MDIIKDTFKAKPRQLQILIDDSFNHFKIALASNDIKYEELRGALTPSHDRRELLLVFDTKKIDNSFYGYEVYKQIIPLFNRDSSHCIFLGDYVDNTGRHQDLLFSYFKNEVKCIRDYDYSYSKQFFMVYINNLTNAMAKRFVDGLRSFDGFIGFADMTFSFPLKIYLTTILPQIFIKYKDTFIMSSDLTEEISTNHNSIGLPLEGTGYTATSIMQEYYVTFLSYKIERPVFKGESDTKFSLNSISANLKDLNKLKVVIDEKKLTYLATEKAGSFKRADLVISKKNLEGAIQAKISENYIYNLEFDKVHNTIKFNLMFEFCSKDKKHKVKLLVALEYIQGKNILRLITAY
jgi:hypothetical protein